MTPIKSGARQTPGRLDGLRVRSCRQRLRITKMSCARISAATATAMPRRDRSPRSRQTAPGTFSRPSSFSRTPRAATLRAHRVGAQAEGADDARRTGTAATARGNSPRAVRHQDRCVRGKKARASDRLVPIGGENCLRDSGSRRVAKRARRRRHERAIPAKNRCRTAVVIVAGTEDQQPDQRGT